MDGWADGWIDSEREERRRNAGGHLAFYGFAQPLLLLVKHTLHKHITPHHTSKSHHIQHTIEALQITSHDDITPHQIT